MNLLLENSNFSKDVKGLLESTQFSPLTDTQKILTGMMLKNTEALTANKLVGEKLDEAATVSGDVAQFTPILMPLVRRVYPQLIAHELLGVQPLTMPTGYIYTLVNRYTGDGDTKKIEPTAKGQILIFADAEGINEGDSITGGTSNASGKVVYKETVGKETRILVGLVTDEKFTLETVNGKTVKAVYSNEATFHKILQNYTGPYLTAAGEKLARDMKEVGLNVDKVAVEAKTRKLKATYTLEMYDDLKSQHGLLADEELISLMSAELQTEIDREVVDFVNSAATVVPDAYAPSKVDGRWEIEKFRVAAIKIESEARNIGLLTKRGQGNVLVVSPKVATMLEQAGMFKLADSAANITGQIFQGAIGTYNNKYKVIVDQYAADDYVTVLYKGSDRRDGIGFFCPYIPASFQRVVNPDSGQPGIILRTRYGMVLNPLEPENYARTFGVDFSGTVLK